MFLTSTPKQLTAIQLTSWINGLSSGIDSAKTNYDLLMNWITTCTDEDYTGEDKAEVVSKITEAMEKATSLIPR